MKELWEFYSQDHLHAGFGNEQQEDLMDHSQIWLHDHNQPQQNQQNFMLDHDTLMFYSDDHHFPSLPDFPCMSSSSSSSSTPAPVKATASSSTSSSAASWAVLKSDADEIIEEIRTNVHDNSASVVAAAMSSPLPGIGFNGGDCTDHMMMETFGYMDLLEDSNEFFDPRCIFQNEQQQQQQQDPLEDLQLESFADVEMGELMMVHEEGKNKNHVEVKHNDDAAEDEDMSKVFLDWLRNNKDTISVEDLRNVRIKKATIDNATRRLGGGKQGMKQLLKLVLEWVQNNHLNKKKLKNLNESGTHNNHLLGFQSPSSSTHPWIQTPSLPPSQPLYSPPVLGYVPGMGRDVYGGRGFTDHYGQLLDSSLSWTNSNNNNNNNLATPQYGLPSPHYNSFVDSFATGPPPPPPQPQGYVAGYGGPPPGGHPYPYMGQYFQTQGGVVGGGSSGDSGLVRLDSSATREARKKRMARQRRFLVHHRHHHGNNNQTQTQVTTDATDNCTMATTDQPNAGNWLYWASSTGAGTSSAATSGFPVDSLPVHAVDRPNSFMRNQNYLPRNSSDRRQGLKPEKNLRFLLQKVLKQSDVNNLGRIVLPKKEAENHLPELDARDGISITMEDIGTSRVWNMRYRYWPNNKSRMYLLENTGDFVRANGLREGDFIVIYSDLKCGKYLIRGVKVRQPVLKPESKRAGKLLKNQPNADANASSSSPTTDATPKGD